MDKYYTITVSADDVANILAALRYWQANTSMLARVNSAHMGEGEFTAYDDAALEELCERINCA